MLMQDMLAWVRMMHDLYQGLTGYRITLDPCREASWYEWHRRGLGPDDLRAIIADRKRRIAAGDLPPQALLFRRLVAQVDWAEEDAVMLRARRERQIAQRRPSPLPPPPDMDEETRRQAADTLRKLRESL